MQKARRFSQQVVRAGLALALAPLALGAVATSAGADEIIVTVKRVKALDKADFLNLGKADFYARMTVDGKVVKSGVIKQKNVITPTWKLSAEVKPGKHDVKLELLDKDAVIDDLIDINRVDKKRHLDFTVDTNKCVITGFSEKVECRDWIVRSGTEKKKAEITFSINVKG
jgi:hypothetical protein